MITRDARLTAGWLLTTVAAGGMLVVAGMLLSTQARGATMELTNDGAYRLSDVARDARRHVRHARRVERIHRVARRANPAVAHGDPRPRAWCGWWLRQRKSLADRKLNLARAWAAVGRPAVPGPGVVVVWPHHVAEIVRLTRPGYALMISGNDGNRVRVRERSIRGAIAFREV